MSKPRPGRVAFIVGKEPCVPSCGTSASVMEARFRSMGYVVHRFESGDLGMSHILAEFAIKLESMSLNETQDAVVVFYYAGDGCIVDGTPHMTEFNNRSFSLQPFIDRAHLKLPKNSAFVAILDLCRPVTYCYPFFSYDSLTKVSTEPGPLSPVMKGKCLLLYYAENPASDEPSMLARALDDRLQVGFPISPDAFGATLHVPHPPRGDHPFPPVATTTFHTDVVW